jgi:CheY-like chemotaxis protein
MEPADILALARAVSTLAWPVLGFALLYRFAPLLYDFIGEADELSAEVAGVRLDARQRTASAAANAAAAAASSGHLDEQEAESIASEVGEDTSVLADAKVLWVDDRPENNRFERQAMEALGASVTTCRSTEDALAALESSDFDVVISDMGRPEGERAGYDLLERKQERGDRTPFIVYSGSKREEHKREARRRGAVGATALPSELFSLVRAALS